MPSFASRQVAPFDRSMTLAISRWLRTHATLFAKELSRAIHSQNQRARQREMQRQPATGAMQNRARHGSTEQKDHDQYHGRTDLRLRLGHPTRRPLRSRCMSGVQADHSHRTAPAVRAGAR